MAARLALIDKQLLLDILEASRSSSSSAPPPNFELTKLNDTQDRVNQVLTEDQSNDPTTQLRKVNSLLTKYDIHKDHFERTAIGPPQRVVLPDEKQTELEGMSHEEIVQFLPKTRKDIGMGILNFMRKNGITWDKQGKIKMMDRELENSNVTDIIHTLARTRKKASPAPHSIEVYDWLRKSNIPLELIGSRPEEMYDPVGKAKKIVKLADSKKRKSTTNLLGPWRRL